MPLLGNFRWIKHIHVLRLHLLKLTPDIFTGVIDFFADIWPHFLYGGRWNSNFIQKLKSVANHFKILQCFHFYEVIGLSWHCLEIKTVIVALGRDLRFRKLLFWFWLYCWRSICNLFNEIVHGRVLTKLLHKHAHVRVPGWKFNWFFWKLPKSQLVTRILIFHHHEGVRPQLNQPQ